MILDVILVGLATYAVTYMLRYTDGPFDVFLRIRKFVGIEYIPIYGSYYAEMLEEAEPEEVVESVPDLYLAKLYDCFWCLGTWVGLLLYILYKVGLHDIVTFFAIVGVAGYLYGKNNQ